ncbi:MAG: DUF4105 domain-containing protein [Elusimicrobia bacterium]|nr:DUF4105 domain-containing protein [Elusimicrobiota bacterium]
MKKAILLLTLLLGASPSRALTPDQELRRLSLRRLAAEQKAWEDPYWRKLLYYEKGFFGGSRSADSDPRFFLSKWGSINPRLELDAAIDGLYFDGEDDESPECRFPERYRWLKTKLGAGSEFPPRRCPSFEEWRAGLDPESVGLIFAAGYLNNPSTLYGHTFLRLHKRGGAGADLLDYTLNYAASTDDEEGFLFALKGLMGAYPGRFSTIPYYLKIQEYHNMENRDLWEFPLDLTQQEIDRLLRHCWELGKASFPYYFFSRNCSWQLVPLLDIVKPELNLSGRFPFWVIPSDTVKAVVSASPAAEPAWRPSLWNTLEWKRASLLEHEKLIAAGLARGGQPASLASLDRLPQDREAAVLETAADYLSWRFYARRISKEELDRRTDPLLQKRAALGQQLTFAGAPQRPPSVLSGHDSLRLGAGLVSLKNGPAYELQARFAMQDLLDDPSGYLPDAALEMGSLRLRYEPRYNRYYLREALLARVLSLNPWDDWVRRRSWELAAGLEQAPETGAQSGRSAVWAMNAASGVSAVWDGPVRQLWYLMAQADSDIGPALRAGWRAGAGLKAGVLASKGPVRVLVEARYISYALGDGRPLWAGSAGTSLRLARDSSVRLQYAWRGDVTETGLYFHQFLFGP